MKLTFLPQNIIHTGEAGKDLLVLAGEAGVEIDGNCAGSGTCGKCKVRIVNGNDFQLTKAEEERLTKLEKERGFRLACCFKPQVDLVVEVLPAEGAAKRKTSLFRMPDRFKADICVRVKSVELANPTIHDQAGDAERLLAACGTEQIDFQAAKKLPPLLQKNRRLDAIIKDNCVIDLAAASKASCYGIAIDIGTTTAVGMLWDLQAGVFLDAAALTNPQGVYGADVISRIMFAQESGGNLQKIHQKIIYCINDMIETFEKKMQISREQIYEMTVVGNTTMSHLFIGVNPRQLAAAPFAPVFCGGISGKARDLGIFTNEAAEFHLLPNIAGHVGSDLTAGILASGFINTDKKTLLLDVGTNGEIILSAGGRTLACSTAAGPAFEGASIHQGMRAAEGAIERVEIENGGVSIKVIGNAEPVGICGSGIIDAVAELLKAGLVDPSGKIITREKARAKGISKSVRERLRNGEHGREFVLGKGMGDVVICQKDVREVQLAKAAISAGIRIMMNNLAIKEEDLDQIYLAGAFGNYIRQESALRIGLLPAAANDKIHSVGNAAGVGSSMALLSAIERGEAEKIAQSVVHLELSACSEFQDEYIKEMKFQSV